MKSRAEVVERELGIHLPEQYKSFLRDYGVYEYSGGEVYGFVEDMVDWGEIPCVIGATRNARKLYNLPNGYIVIHHTGYEDEMVCLDTETGKVHSVTLSNNQQTADSFAEWFKRDILDKH